MPATKWKQVVTNSMLFTYLSVSISSLIKLLAIETNNFFLFSLILLSVPDLACFALFLAHDHGPDLSFSRWGQCYKSRGSFPVCLACQAKAVQCPPLGPKIGDKSQQIPRYSPVSPWGQPPGMAADKCIISAWYFLKCSFSSLLNIVSPHKEHS